MGWTYFEDPVEEQLYYVIHSWVRLCVHAFCKGNYLDLELSFYNVLDQQVSLNTTRTPS